MAVLMKERDNLYEKIMAFFRNNLSGYKNIFISIVIFLFIINIVSIFLIGMTTGVNEQIIENDNLNILELYPDNNQESLTKEQVDALCMIEGVSGAYYTEGISIECIKDSTGSDTYNFSVFKLDSAYLKYYGLPEVDSQTYFLGNLSANPELKPGDKFIAQKNEISGSEDVDFEVTDIVTLPNTISGLVPQDVCFADPETFDKLLINCDSWYTNNEEYSQRLSSGATIHVIVPDVTKQNEVATAIREQHKNLVVSYIMENASKLPAYADAFFKIGIVLLIALFVFYFLSIRNNIAHILKFRTHGIKLFYTLGVEHKKIVKHFYYEFIILGFFSWIIQFLVTGLVVIIGNSLLDMDLYLTAIFIVTIENVLLLFISFIIQGYFMIKNNIKRILQIF